MTRSNDDTNQTDLVAGFILDDLSLEEADLLDRALAEDPSLYGEIASFQEAIALLSYDITLREPPASLKDKIISAAVPSPVQIASKVVPLAARPQRNWKRWIPAMTTGIAAVTIAAFSLNQIQLSQQARQTIALQQKLDATNAELKRLRSELEANERTIARLTQADTRVYLLVGGAPNSGNNRAMARLWAKPGDLTVTLVAQNLPKLRNNQIYRLWAVATPSVAPMYCGQFRQDDRGKAQWVAPNVACTKNPSQLLITLDAPSDPITSAGPLVMRSAS
jgi:anti-sigma-K factor RskA